MKARAFEQRTRFIHKLVRVIEVIAVSKLLNGKRLQLYTFGNGITPSTIVHNVRRTAYVSVINKIIQWSGLFVLSQVRWLVESRFKYLNII